MATQTVWKMDRDAWGTKGATLSEKNAVKEFGLTQEQLRDPANGLQTRQRNAYGNTFSVYIRAEVEALAKQLRGNSYEVEKLQKRRRELLKSLKAAEENVVLIQGQLRAVAAELGERTEATAPEPTKKKARKTKATGKGKDDDDWCPE